MLPSVFQPEYDVVIIGSGVGGLTAGALLSKAGLRVAVLEAASVPGGYLSGFRRKDFRFDTAIHWLNQYMPGGMVYKIFDILGNDYPKAVPQTHIRRYVGEGYDYLLTNNPDELKQQWQAEFPEDRRGIEQFFRAAKKLGKSFYEFGHVFRSEETMGFFQKLKNKRKLLKFVMPFIPHLRYSGDTGIRKGLNKYFKSEKLQRVFSSDDEMLGCLVPIGWAYYGDYQSPPHGGGQVIPEWLIHVMQHHGGELHLKSRVNQVLVDNGIANGVLLHHRGNDYTLKCRYVIAACDAGMLYNQLLPPAAVPEKIKQLLKAAALYTSSVTISIALDCPPATLGFGEELIHIASESSIRGPHNNGDALTSEISILAPSHRDPSLAPAGQGTLVLFMPAWMHFENEWRTERDASGKVIRGEAYLALKEEVASIIIDRVARKVAPELRRHILFYDVATPITHHRYTGNEGGTMMGAKPGRANMQNKVARYQTPVKNLFLGGHWAELGGGVPIAAKAAVNASLMVLRHESPTLFQLMCDYMDGRRTIHDIQKHRMMKHYESSWQQSPTPAQKAALRKANALGPEANTSAASGVLPEENGQEDEGISDAVE